MSCASMVTGSRVRPICRRKDTPLKDPRELVGLGALRLPLESRPDRTEVAGGESDGVGEEAGSGRAVGSNLWDTGGDELLLLDIWLATGFHSETSSVCGEENNPQKQGSSPNSPLSPSPAGVTGTQGGWIYTVAAWYSPSSLYSGGHFSRYPTHGFPLPRSSLPVLSIRPVRHRKYSARQRKKERGQLVE